MRAALSLITTLAIAASASWLPACAGRSERGPTILDGMDATVDEAQSGSANLRPRALEVEVPILLPHRGPGSRGVAYRLTLEIEGERATRRPTDHEPQPSVREEHALEAEFRKLPVEGVDSGSDMFLVGLDGLLYTQKQQNPQVDRKIEIADDRLRVMINGEISVDNRGERVIGPLAPRIFLNRIFGVITHDPRGNPIRLSSRGAPAARRFMNEIPILGAVAYTMVSLPQDPIAPGSRWSAVRIPPSRSGELGLSLAIDYSLASFELFEGVPCAMILLDSHISENGFTGLMGREFDRVEATVKGKAWVELENSRVRRVLISDQIRARWKSPGAPKMSAEHRIQHSSKLELALRDPDARAKKWSDGRPHFDGR
jgi:hypothetical protein